MLSGKNSGSTGCAKSVGAITASQSSSLVGDSVNVRCFEYRVEPGTAIRTDRVRAVIVAHYEQDVGSVLIHFSSIG